ncbi:MAG: sialate O-acetylesterase [Planctomycetaceae bacterium]
MIRQLKRRFLGMLLCAVAVATSQVPAQGQDAPLVADIFTSHMVLQRDVAVPVWGWSAAGSAVTVTLGEQTQTAKADDSGRWQVALGKLKASKEPTTMTVKSGDKVVTFEDVLVGDVWICSGQSNMEWGLNSSLNGKDEVAAADHPTIRLFNVPGHPTSPLPNTRITGQAAWQVCSPGSAGGFSAVGYFFGRRLNQETGVPIGLIGSNWGGTRIEPWTPPVGFRNVPELASISKQVDQFDPTQPAGKETWAKHADAVAKWEAAKKAAEAAGTPVPEAPKTPGFNQGGQPTAIYNAMISPLAPYAIRGAIWYQGESNGGEGVEYFHKMTALIEGWRSVWNQTDLPINFYFVQLANFQKPTDNPEGGDGWARIREAQRQSLTIPHTGMAVITDIGEAGDIHPRNKQDVGTRLAAWALRDVHEMKDVVVSGPLYKSMKIEGNKIAISFDHVGGGLMVGKKEGLSPTVEDKEGKLARFAIAGEDKQWKWADAVIVGDTVVVSSNEVAAPVAVRYAYSMNPLGANLYNKAGFPASPFRTDSW